MSWCNVRAGSPGLCDSGGLGDSEPERLTVRVAEFTLSWLGFARAG